MKYDVIVVGSGSGGGTVASRLSEDESRTVLLLEAGPDFPTEDTEPPGFVTAGRQWAHQAVPEFDWNYWSEPLAGGRRIRLWRGRLVGGSSMTNGCVAVRGAPRDFAAWETAGGNAWSFAALRPLYEVVERELNVHSSSAEHWQPIHHRFHEAFLDLGFRAAADLNAHDSWDGVVGPVSLNRRDDVRQGSLVTYIRRARHRPNFEIRAGALVDRVLLRGSRAKGVRYVDGTGRARTVEADLVVLAAGAYGSPAILLRSGVGPATELSRLAIEPRVDLPVGASLMDHPVCVFPLRAPALSDMHASGFAVFARGDGWLSSSAAIDQANGVCAIAFVLSDEARGGSLTLLSEDPSAPPRIMHIYDLRGFARPLEVLRDVLGTSALAGAVHIDEGRLGEELVAERVGTAFHPAGTCPIGVVVDGDLRVHGIDGLMIADASVFPGHVANNPNLTCFVVGERAATIVTGRNPESPRDQPAANGASVPF